MLTASRRLAGLAAAAAASSARQRASLRPHLLPQPETTLLTTTRWFSRAAEHHSRLPAVHGSPVIGGIGARFLETRRARYWRYTRHTTGVVLATSAAAAGYLALEKPTIQEPVFTSTDLPDASLLQLAPRACYLAALFTPLCCLAVPAFSLGIMKQFWYRLLVWTLEKAGCAFIKWGQWAATRADLFPPDMCDALASLHSHVPPHSWRDTEQIVHQALGVPLRDVFSDFDREPLGSGSVAQVHRARLHGEADFVAVKVRHPDVVRSMRTDFVILARLGEFLDSFPSLQWLGVPESLRTFAHAVASQVRLDIEAANLARFRRNFRASPHISASFPCPRPKLVSRAVLVESFEPGRSISACVEVLHVAQRLARRQAEAAPDELSAAAAEQWDLDDDRPIAAELPLSAKAARHVVETGKEVYLQMLLVHNFVHADLHPGNIFLREEPGRPPTLVLVDAGMVDVLSEREQDNFVGLFRAMGKGDGREAARRLLGFSDSQPGGPESHAAFADEMEGIFGRSCRGFRTGVDIGSVLGEILASLRKHQVRVDARYATAMVNLLCIESFASKLDPEYNLLDASEGLLRAHEALGQRTLAWVLPMLSPALAAYRTGRDFMFWKVPYFLEQKQQQAI